MRFGAHLPVIGFGGSRLSGTALLEYAETAESLGFSTLCANDHLRFSVPWTDGLAALSAAAARTSSIRLMTTAALVVVRGAAALGSALVAIQVISGGRLAAAVTAGSTQEDYEAAGIPFTERWPRFDAEIRALKNYLNESAPAELVPPLWIASWGSEAGLRRVARHADGWLASAYHATPEHFASAWSYLRAQLGRHGRDPDGFPNAVATTYLLISDDPAITDGVLRMLVSPRQAPADLRDRSLVGSAEECIEKLRRLQAAGVQEVMVWPVGNESAQLRLFAERVFPIFASEAPAQIR